MVSTTTSGSYLISSRKKFDYVVSWEFLGPNVKWTAVVRDGSHSTKLLVGEIALDKQQVSVSALVRRQVEERIDRLGAGTGPALTNVP
jgi:hypothetical protein